MTIFHLHFKEEKNASVVTASIADKDDLTTFKNSINSVSSDTGIVADLVNNKSSILLIQMKVTTSSLGI